MAQSNYGTVYTARQVAQQLRETNRDVSGDLTWQIAEQSALVGMQKQESALSQSYREATASAYDSYLKNKRAITSSDIIGESKGQLIKQQQQALSEAYNTYQSSYIEGQESIAENYVKQITNIDDALMKQAEMTAKYANYHGDYYDYLVKNYGDTLSSQELWKNRMMTDVTDEQGNPTGEKRLATWNELKSKMYDEEGNLTLFGIDIIDQLENAEIGTGMKAWGEFLATTDADVLDWAQSYNPYNFTVGGTNAATFRTMTGRLSTDSEYSFLERFGGLGSEQIDTMFSKFTEALDKLESYGSEKLKNKGKDVISEVKDITNELNTFAKELGIDKEINNMLEQVGIKNGLQGLIDNIDSLYSKSKTTGEMTGDWFYSAFVPTEWFESAYKSFSESPSKYEGSFGPGLIEGIAKLLAPWTYASADTDFQRKNNKQLAKTAMEGYRQVLNNMIMYMHQQQLDAQERFVSGIL